jgi:hypothetical protein
MDPYPLDLVLVNWKKSHDLFHKEPNNDDPTVIAKINAFTILEIEEPLFEGAGKIPEEAKKRKKDIRIAAQAPVNDSTLKKLISDYQNAVVNAFENLKTKELVEIHLNELKQCRIKNLQQYYRKNKKILYNDDYKKKILDRGKKMGLSDVDLDECVIEIFGKKPEKKTSSANPNREFNKSLYNKKFKYYNIFNYVPGIIAFIAAIPLLLFFSSLQYRYTPPFPLDETKSGKPIEARQKSFDETDPWENFLKKLDEDGVKQKKENSEKERPVISSYSQVNRVNEDVEFVVRVISRKKLLSLEYRIPGRKAWVSSDVMWRINNSDSYGSFKIDKDLLFNVSQFEIRVSNYPGEYSETFTLVLLKK